jgi:hypothetical protein
VAGRATTRLTKDLPVTPLTNDKQPEKPVPGDSNVFMPYDSDSESDNYRDDDDDDEYEPTFWWFWVDWGDCDGEPSGPEEDGESHKAGGRSCKENGGKSSNAKRAKSRKGGGGKVRNETAAKPRTEEGGR